MVLPRCLFSLSLAASLVAAAGAAAAQAPDARQQQEIAQGEHCLMQMERDAQGAIATARRVLSDGEAGDIVRTMSLVCLVRSQLMTGQGSAALDPLPELLQLLESASLPPQLRIKLRMYTATALQELGLLQEAGEVLQAALAESGPYTNQHLQALVGVALHHARGMRDPAAAEPYFERAIAVTRSRPGGPIPLDALPHFNYGLAVLEQGRTDDAEALLQQARALAHRDPQLDRLTARIDSALGRVALERGELAAARARLEGVVPRQRAIGDAPGLASSLRSMAELALLEGAPAQALEHGGESARIVQDGQMADQIHEALEQMARIHSALGNAAESREWSERARRHLAQAAHRRNAGIGAALHAHAPQADGARIDHLGSLTRARAIGTLAVLALVATLLAGGWSLARSRRHQRELARISATDALTGLANRHHATRVLEGLPAGEEGGDARAALLLLDVDRFKAINDLHGHDAGDRVLAALGQCLRQACDANDLVARWGGEEFLVLRPRTSRAAAHALAEHLRQAVHALPVPLPGGGTASVTVSIGMAPCPYFPDAPGRWQDAIRMADRALYAAKHSGRDAWASTWGEAAGRHVDVYSVRQDPEAALAQGWISAAGSRPITWARPPAGGFAPPAASTAAGGGARDRSAE